MRALVLAVELMDHVPIQPRRPIDQPNWASRRAEWAHGPAALGHCAWISGLSESVDGPGAASHTGAQPSQLVVANRMATGAESPVQEVRVGLTSTQRGP
jgi:hypothetical protein